MRILTFLSLFLCSLSVDVYARSPVVVEFFTQYDCTQEAEIYEPIFNLLKEDQDIIMVNCVRYFEGKQDFIDGVMQHFCNARHTEYKEFLGNDIASTSPLIVNGRWSSSRDGLGAAVNFARLDEVKSISIENNGLALDITLPKLDGKSGGEMVLYTYMPTRDEKKIYVDSDVDFNDEMLEKIKSKRSVPFVTEARATPPLIRPMFSRHKLGHWSGEAMSFSYPLVETYTDAGDLFPELSFALVVYEGDKMMGTVVAAGEVMSTAEIANLLPKSQALEIEFSSQPDGLQTLSQ